MYYSLNKRDYVGYYSGRKNKENIMAIGIERPLDFFTYG